MTPTRAPMIQAGQLYLNADLNEYLIVTQNNRGQINYAGVGFKGHSEDQSFIERFKPVDPKDVDSKELRDLVSLCRAGTEPSTGFIVED